MKPHTHKLAAKYSQECGHRNHSSLHTDRVGGKCGRAVTDHIGM